MAYINCAAVEVACSPVSESSSTKEQTLPVIDLKGSVKLVQLKKAL